MEYILPALLILLGVVNTNLIRVALRTGVIQSRMVRIVRSEGATAFWSAILFQALVSVLSFGAAWLKLREVLGPAA